MDLMFYIKGIPPSILEFTIDGNLDPNSKMHIITNIKGVINIVIFQFEILLY